MILSPQTRAHLCAALLRIKAVHDPEIRDQCASELDQLPGRQRPVPRSSDAPADVQGPVDFCATNLGLLRTLGRLVAAAVDDTAAVAEFERVLRAATGEVRLSPQERRDVTELLGQAPPNAVAVAARTLLGSDAPASAWTTGRISTEVEGLAVNGAVLDLLALVEDVAHRADPSAAESDQRAERSRALELHRWIDEVGGQLGLNQQDLRSLCVDTTARQRADEFRIPGVSTPANFGKETTLPEVLPISTGEDNMPAPTVAPTDSAPNADVRLIWGGVPLRNPEFTGREQLLDKLREALLKQSKASVLPEALHGSGGVGKTQLAVEYVYRHAQKYDLVWWISAEQTSLVRQSLAKLGERLHLPASQDMQQTATTVLDALGASPLRWLMVYDNADDPEGLAPLLPSAGGHVIITSRNQAWATVQLGHAIEVDVFDRAESIELLTRRSQDEVRADELNLLAENLGDLPLALEQAAIWRAATGMSVGEYLRLFENHVQELMAEGQPPSYRNTVYAFLSLAFQRLRTESPAAAQLFELFAFLGAEPLSTTMLRSGRLSDAASPLAAALRDSIAMNRAIRELRRYGLAKVDPNGQRIQVHRLVQLVLREGLRDDRREQALLRVQEILALADPGSPDEPSLWPRYLEIGPHIRAADLINARDRQARNVVLDYARFLYRTGDYEASRALSQRAVDVWSQSGEDSELGPNHDQTLVAQSRLANALALLGDIRDAARLSEQTLVQMRAHPDLGDNHEHTLQVANQYARDLRLLGEFSQALAEDENNLERHRLVFGDEDERTLLMRNNVAVNLRILGDFKAAYHIDRAVSAQWHETVGDAHVRTLFSQSNLARDLYGLGQYAEALELLRKGLPLLREQLPPGHSEVLLAARTITITTRKLGRYQDALQLARENYREYQARFGDEHDLTLAATMTLANTLRVHSELPEAHTLAASAVSRYTSVLGEKHPLTLVAQVNLAIILRALGQHREAYDLDSFTVEAMRTVLGPQHAYTLCAETGLANDLSLRHSLQAASALSHQTLAASAETRGAEHPYTLACSINAAFDLQASGDKQRGQELFESTIDAMRTILGPEHPEVLDANRGKRAECDIEPPPT